MNVQSAEQHPCIVALQERFPDIDFAPAPLVEHQGKPSDQWYVRVEPTRLLEVTGFLRQDERCSMEQLIDITCVDYLNFPKARDRYGVNYSLLSLTHNHRLWIKCFVNDPEPKVPTVTGIWQGANWMEREIFDMFGIVFEGHPDLRRILTWEGFEAFPLRKDYPLRGQGERESYDIVTRESA